MKGTKKNKDYFNALVIIPLLIIVLMFSLGQQGCQMPSQKEKLPTGLHTQILSGVDYISQGKQINVGDSFYVGFKLTNYDAKPRQGQVCIKDNLDDYYGGISQQCLPFNVNQANIITGTGKKTSVEPSTIEVVFPQQGQGQYSYQNLNVQLPATIYTNIVYTQSNTYSSTLSVPTPETESQHLTSDEPVSVSVTKTIHSMSDHYEIALEITLTKVKDVDVMSPDFKQKALLFGINALPLNFECKSQSQGFMNQALIDFNNERLIKCNAVTTSKEETAYPLQIRLDYGVVEHKTINFILNPTS